ncbi:MAG: AMP-binding protein [Candidatus Cloacimonetes bacterium]|nr:AMP-binding protein [Candidatus Cloacimonadota bacterium]
MAEQVFKGYYKFEEATREMLRDGWLYSGDIGTIDADGFVYIRGRSKNVILGPSGENIYPELVEQKLNNMPYVGEALVLERDRQLHAMVYPDFENLDAEHIPETKIPILMEENRKEVNKVLADFSRIIKIHIVNEPFQKTPTQKIKRYLYS